MARTLSAWRPSAAGWIDRPIGVEDRRLDPGRGRRAAGPRRDGGGTYRLPPLWLARVGRVGRAPSAGSRAVQLPRRPAFRFAGVLGAGLDGSALLLLLAAPAATAASDCGWREPPRTYPDGVRWACTAFAWPDGDTLAARCEGRAGPVMVRPRVVDAEERGEGRWRQAREKLRRRTDGQALVVSPRHDSHRRVVADVLAGGVDVGAAMDAAGWSKAGCPKR